MARIPSPFTTPPRKPDPVASVGVRVSVALALTQTAYGGAAVAGAISPTTANKPTAVSRLLSSVQCGSGADSGINVPDASQLFPGFVTIGDGDAGTVAGMLVSTMVCLVCVAMVNVAVAVKWPGDDGEPLSLFASLCVAAHGIGLSYIGPNVANAAVTLLTVGDASAMSRIVAVVSCGVVGANTTVTLWASLQRAGPASVGLRGKLSHQWQSFVAGSRDADRSIVRLYIFEDIGVALTLACVSGVVTASIALCVSVSCLMTVVTAVHVVYLIVVRPYHSRAEQWLANANAMILIVIAALTDCIMFRNVSQGTSESDDSLLQALGVALLAANAFFFVQALVLCGIAMARLCFGFSRLTDETIDGSKHAPLLDAIPTPITAEGEVRNPLEVQPHPS